MVSVLKTLRAEAGKGKPRMKEAAEWDYSVEKCWRVIIVSLKIAAEQGKQCGKVLEGYCNIAEI